MLELNLPSYQANVKDSNGRLSIFDCLRKRFVKLTPEEWVRQHFINYLITEKAYPNSLIANEIQINLNDTKKRCDSVVYNLNLEPLVIIEYKAPNVKITQATFDQIVRYNIVLKVAYLIVTNGLHHYCCYVDYSNQTITYLPDIPSYTEL